MNPRPETEFFLYFCKINELSFFNLMNYENCDMTYPKNVK